MTTTIVTTMAMAAMLGMAMMATMAAIARARRGMARAPDARPRDRSAGRLAVLVFVALGVLAVVVLAGCPGFGVIRPCPAGELSAAERDAITARLQAIGDVPELMAAVEELERCGKLDELSAHVTAHATGDVRLRLAIVMVQTLGRGSTSPSAFKLLMFKAQALPESDLRAFLRWAGNRLVRHAETEALLAFAEGTIPVPDEVAIHARATSSVPAGPWAPPGKQPIPLYIGSAVHEAIGLYYQTTRTADAVEINTSPIASILRRLASEGVGPPSNRHAAAVGALAIRPDITNLSTLEVYEIKPAGAEAVALALVNRYIAAFAKYGVTMRPGRTITPGTSGILPAPAGHILFYSPVPGVISYQYRRGAYVRDLLRDPLGSRAPLRYDASERRVAADDDEGFWEYLEKVTGLTGTALVLYLVLSEGSRVVFPPRNFVPVL